MIGGGVGMKRFDSSRHFSLKGRTGVLTGWATLVALCIADMMSALFVLHPEARSTRHPHARLPTPRARGR